MVKLTDQIMASPAGTDTLFLVTSSKEGIPNVVPIGAFKLIDDDTLLISDQYFLKTLRNLKENPAIALSW